MSSGNNGTRFGRTKGKAPAQGAGASPLTVSASPLRPAHDVDTPHSPLLISDLTDAPSTVVSSAAQPLVVAPPVLTPPESPAFAPVSLVPATEEPLSAPPALATSVPLPPKENPMHESSPVIPALAPPVSDLAPPVVPTAPLPSVVLEAAIAPIAAVSPVAPISLEQPASLSSPIAPVPSATLVVSDPPFVPVTTSNYSSPPRPIRIDEDLWLLSSPLSAHSISSTAFVNNNASSSSCSSSAKKLRLEELMQIKGGAPSPNASSRNPDAIAALGWKPNGSANEDAVFDQFSTLPSNEVHLVELNYVEDAIKSENVLNYLVKCDLPLGEITSKDGSIYISYERREDYEVAMNHPWAFGILFRPGQAPWDPKASMFSFYHMFTTVAPLDNDFITAVRNALWALDIDAKFIRQSSLSTMFKVGFRNAQDFRRVGEYKDPSGNWSFTYGNGKRATLNLVSTFFVVDVPSFFKMYCGGLTGAEDPQRVRERIGLDLSQKGFLDSAAVFFGAKPGVKYGFLLVEGKGVYDYLLGAKINTQESCLYFSQVEYSERSGAAKRKRN